MRELSVDVLHELLILDADTGQLFWRERTEKWVKPRALKAWNTRYANKEALAAQRPDGYRHGCIFHYLILAHRVVFAMFNGYWPTKQIDHRDCNPSNNHPNNLREATHAENKRNEGSRGGASMFRGVSPSGYRWRATCGGQHIGYFASETDAAQAYDLAATKRFGEFARPNCSTQPMGF